jgi:hypothetical protein
MTSDKAQSYLLGLWIALVGIQVANQVIGAYTAKKTATTSYLVPPNKFIASSVVYTGLLGLGAWAPSLAVALGVGIDFAALLSPTFVGGQSTSTFLQKASSFVTASA